MILHVRKTYFDINCENNTVGPQKTKLQQMIDQAVLTWPSSQAAAGNNWQEYKVGTVGGRQLLLLLEFGDDPSTFGNFDFLKRLVIRQQSNRFRLKNKGEIYTYSLFNYVPFRAKAHQHYQQAKDQATRCTLLSHYLQNHLRLLADRLQLTINSPLLNREVKLVRQKRTRLSGHLYLSFDLQFESPLFIPEFMGIGLNSAMGCGVVRQARGNR